eukprot:scaffold7.g3503.t1
MGSVQELLECSIARWHPAFKHVTFSTVVLSLPQHFVDWLVADGVHLQEESEALGPRARPDPLADEDDYREWSSEDEEEEGEGAAAQRFPELEAAIRQAIAALGGRVVPKLTWSAPKDATWVMPGGSLACATTAEVLLLLKSSDRVAHDICHACEGLPAAPGGGGGSSMQQQKEQKQEQEQEQEQEKGQQGRPAVQHCLALRRWHDLRPERELRCFVRGGSLVGACQRDVTQRYHGLEAEAPALERLVRRFYAEQIAGKFPLLDFTYDLYVTTTQQVRLVDFNPVGGTTAPLLFTWEELGYTAPAEAASREGGANAAGEGAAQQQERAAESGAASAAAGAAAGAAEVEGSAAGAEYLEQLQRVQGLALTAAERRERCAGAGDNASASGDRQRTPAARTAAAEMPATATAAPLAQAPEAAAAARSAPAWLGLRLITEPVALRPAKMAYGVPFDFVDASEGSALDSLLKQARGGGAPEELWAELRRRAASG